MEDTHQPDQLPPSDEFQQAVAAAQNEASEHHWSEMSPREQTRAIYAQLRRIDAERAVAIAFNPSPSGRYRAAGKSVRREPEP
jgi:hypothetical protein